MAPPDARGWEALDAIKCRIDALADVPDAPSRALPTYWLGEDGARAFIELSPDGMLHRVVRERGKEIDRKSTHELDELLYWVFESVTHRMATDHECRHRRPDEDSRRQWFCLQLELLGRLHADWPARRAAELDGLLADAGVTAAELAPLTSPGDRPGRAGAAVRRESVVMVSRRRFGRRDFWHRYRIEVDSRARGDLRPGGSVRVALYPGRHRVVARIGWGWSKAMALRLDPGETARLVVAPGRGPRRLRTGGWRGEPAPPYLNLETVGPVTLDD